MKMYLKHVTITGADENTDINEVVKITKEYPFVEWGILISSNKAGSDRYPQKEWIKKFMDQLFQECQTPNISFHFCGAISRDIIIGKIDVNRWYQHIKYFEYVKRFQINVNTRNTPPEYDSMAQLLHSWSKHGQPIIQHNKANVTMWAELVSRGIFPNVLFDASGGRGTYIRTLPSPIPGLFCGFSGGISDYNIDIILRKLNELDGICWIDMESGVRDENNKLVLNRVRHVLKQCKHVAI